MVNDFSAYDRLVRDAVSPAVMKSLGELLRDARVGRYTIEELARRSNVSAGRISQIERGIGNPSLETLMRLAASLDLRFGSLFASEGTEEQAVVRCHERKKLDVPGQGLVYEMLTPNVQGALEIFVLEIPPGYDGAGHPQMHRGEKFIHVENGRLTVAVAERTWTLATGDSITFDARDAHFVRNEAGDTASLLVVVTPPTS